MGLAVESNVLTACLACDWVHGFPWRCPAVHAGVGAIFVPLAQALVGFLIIGIGEKFYRGPALFLAVGGITLTRDYLEGLWTGTGIIELR